MFSTRRGARVGGAQQAWITLPLAVLLFLCGSSLWIATVNGAPAKFDSNESPFPLELQPPLLDDGATSSFDSYGNPIDTLKPIDTPDGRKVVSAQGLQFEIPTYASGITEIKKPADDLLPPHIDPIAVALPNNAQQLATTTTTTNNAQSSTFTTTASALDETSNVEIEQANLVKVQHQHQEAGDSTPQAPAVNGDLPDYLRALNDPDIAGPVAWTPAPNGEALKVIAWDLLPPHKDATPTGDDQQQASQEPVIITHDHQAPPKRVQGVQDPVTHNIRVTLSTGNTGLGQVGGVSAQAGQVSVVDVNGDAVVVSEQETATLGHGTNAHVGGSTPSTNNRFPSRGHNRGTVHYSTTTTTPRTTTTTTTTPTTTTTTTTRRPTTTTTTTTRRPTTTTTTRRPTTTTTRATTTTTTTTAPLDSAYKLPNEEEYAYTLPPWLSGVTDPDLDVAVTFIVPEDNDKYNHTLERDLEPPFEPFVDVKDLQVTPPPTLITSITARPKTTASTTTTTTTTRRPPTATTRANWVRANPTSTTTTNTTPIQSTLSANPENGAPSELNNRFNSNNLAPNHIQTLAHKPKPSSTTTTLSSPSPSTPPIPTPTQAATPSLTSVFNTGKWQHAAASVAPAAIGTISNSGTFKSNIATTTSTPVTDLIATAEATGVDSRPQASRNPFLPKPFERQPTATPLPTTTTTARTTTTATTARTTTTTPTPLDGYKNPFNSATIPPWLIDFDYADVGPGVAYDPKNFREDNRDTTTFNNNNNNNNNRNPNLSFKPFQAPQGFAHQTTASHSSPSSTSTSTSTTAFSSSFGVTPKATTTTSAFPSKVTLPLPSINQQAPINDNDGTPTLVLTPPADNVETSDVANGNEPVGRPTSTSTLNAQNNPTTSSTNTNFAAHLEPHSDSTATDSGDSFPPFQSNDVNIPTATQKFEYTKSDEGKVIITPLQAALPKDTLTNSVFNAASGSGSTFGDSQTSFASTSSFGSTTTSSSTTTSGQIDASTSGSISASGKYTGGFGGPPGLLRPKLTNSGATGSRVEYVAGDENDYAKNVKSTLKPTIKGKYTGGFGAPAGINAPNDRAFIPYRNNQQSIQTRFGGPPGVLVPFDNEQGGGQ